MYNQMGHDGVVKEVGTRSNGSMCVRVEARGGSYVWNPAMLATSGSGALPGGYTPGDAVRSTEVRTFKSGGRVDNGEQGTVRGLSDDGDGLEVKFEGGVLVDCSLDQVTKVNPTRSSSSRGGDGSRVSRLRQEVVAAREMETRLTMGDVVVICPGEHRGGQRGVIVKDDGPGDAQPYKVQFSDDSTKWYRAEEVTRPTGMAPSRGITNLAVLKKKISEC